MSVEWSKQTLVNKRYTCEFGNRHWKEYTVREIGCALVFII